MLTIARINRQYRGTSEAYVSLVHKGAEGIPLTAKKYAKRTVWMDAEGGEYYGMKVKKLLQRTIG